MGRDPDRRCPMAVIPDPRTSHYEPPPSMLDTAAGSLIVIAAALGTILLIWIFVGIGARVTDLVDPDAVPLVETQPVGPAPIPTP